jgi:transcriptional regulator with XRE-family HTH domain
MSQEDLARRAGVSLRAFRSLERGEAVDPHYSTLSGIAKALNISVAELMGEPAVPLGEASVEGARLRLEDVRAFLETHLGSSLIAAPEEEWARWWRDVSSMEEAAERYEHIRAEWKLLQEEWLATHGKGEAEPRLVPRGRPWGEVYYKLFARQFSAAFHAPQRDESEKEFLARREEGRAIDAYYQEPVQRQHEEQEQQLRTLEEVPA